MDLTVDAGNREYRLLAGSSNARPVTDCQMAKEVGRARGFEAQLVVDVRLLRDARVVGFKCGAPGEFLGDRNVRTEEPGVTIDHPEAAEMLLDRLIVAHAARHGAPLVSRDRWILEHYRKAVW